MYFPREFVDHIEGAHGELGRRWLRSLPEHLAWACREWGLQSLALIPDLSYNYVAFAQREDRQDVVLKLGVVCLELTNEIAALQLFGGKGAVRLLDSNIGRGALLLERLQPGRMLVDSGNDLEATTIAAGVMQELWRPVPDHHTFPTVADWAKGFQRYLGRYGGTTGPLPAALVHKAERLFRDLDKTGADPVLLHGDLHHYNILSSHDRSWLAIDPKGVIGEPTYEVGALLRNPYPQIRQVSNLHSLMDRRLRRLAEILDLDMPRMAAWSMAQAVLSACWTIEESGTDWAWGIDIAVALESFT